MLPISRCMGGTTRPRDLRILSSSRGSHLSLPPDTPLVERVPGSARKSVSPRLSRSSKDLDEAVDTTQWSSPRHQTQKNSQGFEGRTALLCEISATPLSDVEPHCFGNVHPRTISDVDASILARSALHPSFASQQTRGFHTSSRVPYDSTSYNVTDVPDFFINYKQHRATPLDAHERNRDGFGLMPALTDSILSGDVVASTRRFLAKIPVEHQATEGRVMHPSGFVVPGPGHTSTSDVARAKERERNESRDRAVQTAAVAQRVLESDFEQVDATTLPSLHKVPFEVREPDGIVKHPSGFVPPTPAHKFRHTFNTNVLMNRKVSAVRQKFRQPSPAHAVLRAVHTTPDF